MHEPNAIEIEDTIAALSRLQLQLDRAQSRGDRAIFLKALERDLAQRKSDIVSRGLMTEQELSYRMRSKILRLQANDISDREERGRERSEVDRRLLMGLKIYFNSVQPRSFVGDVNGTKSTMVIEHAF